MIRLLLNQTLGGYTFCCGYFYPIQSLRQILNIEGFAGIADEQMRATQPIDDGGFQHRAGGLQVAEVLGRIGVERKSGGRNEGFVDGGEAAGGGV